MREFTISDRTITDKGMPYIVAELGHNHQGDPDVCKRMILQAKMCGADAVKLQRIDSKLLFTKTAYDTPYNSENAFAETYGKHRDTLTLNDSDFIEMKEYAHSIGLHFLCTAFEENSVTFLDELGVDAFKIASFHAKDKSLVEAVKKTGRPIIVSTGHCELPDIVGIHKSLEGSKFALLQCTSEYPVRNPVHINLGVIRVLRGIFKDTVIGYSHHYGAPFVAASSVFFGAGIIETHFTLNRLMKGTDHAFSLEPDGLRWLVNQAKLAVVAMGIKKQVYEEERAPISKMRRTVYPSKSLKKGDVVKPEDLRLRAPAPFIFDKDTVIGKVINVSSLSTAVPIKEEDLE